MSKPFAVPAASDIQVEDKSAIETRRTVQDRLDEIALNVLDFGAVGDGTVDDYPAFLAAYNALPDNGGAILVPADKRFIFKSTLVVGDGTATVPSTKKRVRIIGLGSGDGSGIGTAASEIRWGGAPGGTVIEFRGMYDGELSNLRIHGGFTADTCLKMVGCQYNRFDSLLLGHTRNGGAGVWRMDGGNGHNHFRLVRVVAQNPGNRALVAGEGDTVGQSGNVFVQCDFYFAGDVDTSCGMFLEFFDNNTFIECYTQQNMGAVSGYGIIFNRPGAPRQWAPAENLFVNCPIMAAAGRSVGGTSGDNGNWFVPYPTGDGETIPPLANLHAFTYDGKIFDGGVQRRTVRNIAIAEAQDQVSTNSLTAVDIPNMSITVNARQGSKIKVSFTCRAFKATAGDGKFQVVFDGTAHGPTWRQIDVNAGIGSVAIVAIFDVTTSGNKTIKVQYWSNDSNSINVIQRQLIVEELY